jgi:hypothetical protein
MALTTLIALTSAMAVGHFQDPTMDLQIAMPVSTGDGMIQAPTSVLPVAPRVAVPHQSATAGQATTDVVVTVVAPSAPEDQTRVTATFRSAKPSAIFDWLEKQGVSFIVKEGDISEDVRVTLNLRNAPLNVVLDSLASALGGRWERRDDVHTFHPGARAPFFGRADMPRAFSLPESGPLPTMPQDFEKAFGPEFAKRFETLGVEIERSFGPEFEAKMQEMAERAQAEAKRAQDHAAKGRAEAQKAREQAVKVQVEARKRAMEAQRQEVEARKHELRSREIVVEQLRKAHGKDSVLVVPGNSVTIRTKEAQNWLATEPANIERFLNSLTTAQKDSQKKRGYVRYNELTREQKQLLGIKPPTRPGSWEVSFKLNGKSATIRD